MTDFLRARRQVLDAVVRELVGPDPCGAALDCSVELRFPDEAPLQVRSFKLPLATRSCSLIGR